MRFNATNFIANVTWLPLSKAHGFSYPSILSGLIHYISPFLTKMLLYMKKKSPLTIKSTVLTIKSLLLKYANRNFNFQTVHSSEERISVHVPQRKLRT